MCAYVYELRVKKEREKERGRAVNTTRKNGKERGNHEFAR